MKPLPNCDWFRHCAPRDRNSSRQQKMMAELEADELDKRQGQIQTLKRKLRRLLIPAERSGLPKPPNH